MSLVSDSLPALKAIADALLNNAKIAASGKEYTAIFQTAQAYKAGKTSVIEYRDSLVELIEWDKKLLASNDNSTEGLLNKAVANKEIEKTTKELATVEASAAYQSELAIKNNTQAKKDNELATKVMQQAEKETQDAITAAREKSTTEYNNALAKINLEVQEVLKTEKEASDEKKKAATDYLGKLNDIIVQYDLTSEAAKKSGTKTIDLAADIAKSLGTIGKVIKTNTELLGAYSDNDKLITDIVVADAEREKQAKYDAGVKTFTDQKNLLGSYSDESKKITDKIVDENEKANEKKLKDDEEYIKSIVSELVSLMSKFGDIYNQDAKKQKEEFENRRGV